MNAFQNFLMRVSIKLRAFMEGRYGIDQLNIVILVLGLIISVAASLFRNHGLGLILVLVSYGLMILAIYRTLSRNIYKRYEENRRYLQLKDRIRDREHVYFSCPKCHQVMRVPRGKGKISVTCPKCREKFTKKS